MNEPVTIRELAAKLLLLGNSKASCPLCFGAGYAWVNIKGFYIPILCKCPNRNRDIFVRGHSSTESLSKIDGSQAEEVVFAIPLRDIIVDYKGIDKVSKKLDKMLSEVMMRRTIEDCEVDENYKDVISCIVDRSSDPNFNIFDLKRLVKMLEKNADESGDTGSNGKTDIRVDEA